MIKCTRCGELWDEGPPGLEGNHCNKPYPIPEPAPPIPGAEEDRELWKLVDAVPMALWEAGFSGEQSAEHGPIMKAAQECVVDALQKGKELERKEWEAQDLIFREVYLKDIAALEAERATLLGNIEEKEFWMKGAMARIHFAEATRDKYKEALEKIASCEPVFKGDCPSIARAAIALQIGETE